MISAGDRLNRRGEILTRNLFYSALYLVDILIENGLDHIAVADPAGCHLYTLDRIELVADHLLHSFLEIRITAVTDLSGKSDNGALRHADHFAELGGSHKRGCIVMLLDV